ncbi:organic solute transporter alpha-like protein [Eupeodes corollae]|uniref:organic solute transporter alpha-like protein n=1 Tax=Eupeodes corollae TaxID=290404 RepID=UPI00248F92A0|nr:organic solute transporter alpha-like protein [Eupeodes corollae]XP_055906326.1 organic solute transporter alpha-like protein [Eupeodes corollae]XP_055906327.1 organic solute transporter alpha-like protein [Eupeodes corollae]XP_055906328.1 organic solute transporter alpha-like protein [Eupeodes corollae]
MSAEQNTTNHSSVDYAKYPDLSEFYSNLTPFVTFSLFIGLLVLCLNLAICATTIVKAKKRLTSNLYIPTTILCSIYPIISLAALGTILAPKSWLACNTVMHLSFTIGAVVFHNLCFRYAHSEVGYLKEIGDEKTLDLQTSPLCCCCGFLPKLTPKKNKLFAVKCLIWQMPLIQSSIMIALNVIYYFYPEKYENLVVFFAPFIVTSILSGLWGLNITVKMINKLFPDYNLMKKMLSLQLVLLLCKLQFVILDSQLNYLDFGGTYPINNTILKQTVINLLILVEMTLVSILVQNSYSKP